MLWIFLCGDVFVERISGGERTNIPRDLFFIKVPLFKKLG